MRMGQRGFSITELMIAMTILAIGLLALAQLQIVSLRGTTASRQFSTATNLAREAIEAVKQTGVYLATEGTVPYTIPIMEDKNPDNGEDKMAPEIGTTTSIESLSFDSIEVLGADTAVDTDKKLQQLCFMQSPNDCDAQIPNGKYVRIVNVKNIPDGSTDGASYMKDINVIVIWKEHNFTRSISIRTMVGRKDSDFF